MGGRGLAIATILAFSALTACGLYFALGKPKVVEEVKKPFYPPPKTPPPKIKPEVFEVELPSTLMFNYISPKKVFWRVGEPLIVKVKLTLDKPLPVNGKLKLLVDYFDECVGKWRRFGEFEFDWPANTTVFEREITVGSVPNLPCLPPNKIILIVRAQGILEFVVDGEIKRLVSPIAQVGYLYATR